MGSEGGGADNDRDDGSSGSENETSNDGGAGHSDGISMDRDEGPGESDSNDLDNAESKDPEANNQDVDSDAIDGPSVDTNRSISYDWENGGEISFSEAPERENYVEAIDTEQSFEADYGEGVENTFDPVESVDGQSLADSLTAEIANNPNRDHGAILNNHSIQSRYEVTVTDLVSESTNQRQVEVVVRDNKTGDIFRSQSPILRNRNQADTRELNNYNETRIIKPKELSHIKQPERSSGYQPEKGGSIPQEKKPSIIRESDQDNLNQPNAIFQEILDHTDRNNLGTALDIYGGAVNGVAHASKIKVGINKGPGHKSYYGIYNNNWGGNKYTKTIRPLNVSKSLTRNLGWAGNTISFVMEGAKVWKEREDEGGFGEKTMRQASISLGSFIGSTAGSTAGAWVGVKAGALAGGSIGSLFGGVGAVPGAAIGSVFGGISGSVYGGDIVKEWGENLGKHINSNLNDKKSSPSMRAKLKSRASGHQLKPWTKHMRKTHRYGR